MRIAVIGAGVVGLSTALELAQTGHEVHVFDRHSSAAAGASFAAAGLLVPVAPHLLQSQGWGPSEWRTRWTEWRLRQSLRQRDSNARDQALTQLHGHGVTRLTQLRRHFRQDLEHRLGWTLLIHHPRQIQAAEAEQTRWQSLGIPHQWLDAEGARQHEPGLAEDLPLQGALHLPQVPLVNLRQLAQQIRQLAEDAGAHFHFQAEVTALTPERPLRLSWHRPPTPTPFAEAGMQPTTPPGEDPTQGHQERFDAAVLCGGPGCQTLLRDLGLGYPLQTISGCSVTTQLHLPEAAPDLGPHGAVTDTASQVTLTRLGDRVRLHLSNLPRRPSAAVHPKDLDLLHRTMDRLFPNVRRSAATQAWQGCCVALPDGAPLIGATHHPGIWLNLAHGSWGAGLALGSAGLVSDLISGLPIRHDSAPWLPSRWN